MTLTRRFYIWTARPTHGKDGVKVGTVIMVVPAYSPEKEKSN